MLISEYNKNSYNNPTFCADISKLTKNKLQKLVNGGYSDPEIAKMYDVSRSTIFQRRKKEGIKSLKKTNKIEYDKYDFYYLRTLIDEGNSLSQIAKFYKTSISSIRYILTHFGLQTQEATLASTVKKEELNKLISEGKTQKEIANILFLEDERTVTHLVKKFKLETPIHKVDKFLPIEKIADLIFMGMKPKEIAQKYNISLATVVNKMKTSGFGEIYAELYQPHDIPADEILNLIKNGYKISEIAEMNHVSLRQMIRYMIKNKILKTNIPLKQLVKSVQEGMSMKDIALNYEVFKSRVPQLLAENNLRTKRQLLKKSLSKEIVKNKIQGCTTYVELAEKLEVSPSTAKRLAFKYGLNLDNDALILPEVKDIKRIILTQPEISIDELAKSLNVESVALERVLSKNKIPIYRPHKVHDYNSFDFTRWVSIMMKHGDSPIQLGELMGISSLRARKIVEKLYRQYENSKYLEFPKIPKDKPSPTYKEIMREIINSSKEYTNLKQKNPYNYSQIYQAKNFMKDQICEKYKISDTTLEYLLNKYELNDIYDNYAKKVSLNIDI